MTTTESVEDRERDPGLRTLGRVALVGGLLALVSAAVVGAAADSGRVVLIMLLLVTALTSSLVGLVGTATLLRDQVRGAPISRARIVITIAGFLGTTLLLAMVIGAATSASAAT